MLQIKDSKWLEIHSIWEFFGSNAALFYVSRIVYFSADWSMTKHFIWTWPWTPLWHRVTGSTPRNLCLQQSATRRKKKTCRTESSKCSELICCSALKSLPSALSPFLPPANCAYCVCGRRSETPSLAVCLLWISIWQNGIYTELQEEHRRCFSIHFGL